MVPPIRGNSLARISIPFLVSFDKISLFYFLNTSSFNTRLFEIIFLLQFYFSNIFFFFCPELYYMNVHFSTKTFLSFSFTPWVSTCKFLHRGIIKFKENRPNGPPNFRASEREHFLAYRWDNSSVLVTQWCNYYFFVNVYRNNFL